MLPRRQTRQITLGNDRVGFVKIGGDAPVSVQTMTSGYTHDVNGCLAEIRKLATAGADVVRVAVPERKDTEALVEIMKETPVPIVADVHFHFKRALEAVEAGVHKIRLNPGNISDRAQVIDVIQACKDRRLPIRIGVNEGSIIERRDKQKRLKELGGYFSESKHGHLLAIMITKLEEYLDIFHEEDFHDIAISAKSIDAGLVIDAYTEISKRFDYPLHLGVTHAGPKETGTIRSVVPLGHLLASGIGDTIRLSYANDPIYEVEDGLELLYTLGLRERKGAELIACPTCGRIQVDLFTLTQDVRMMLKDTIRVPMKVAVMGCVVNGPGEPRAPTWPSSPATARGSSTCRARRSPTCRRTRSWSASATSARSSRPRSRPARRSWARKWSRLPRPTRSGNSAAAGRKLRPSGRGRRCRWWLEQALSPFFIPGEAR